MVRQFTGEPVSAQSLERILDNAVRGPSAGFSQGQAFLVLTDPEDLKRFWAVAGVAAAEPVAAAPLVIVPMSSKRVYLDRYALPDKGWTRPGREALAGAVLAHRHRHGRPADPADGGRRGPGRAVLRHRARSRGGVPRGVRRTGGSRAYRGHRHRPRRRARTPRPAGPPPPRPRRHPLRPLVRLEFHDHEGFNTPWSSKPFAIMNPPGAGGGALADDYFGYGEGGVRGQVEGGRGDASGEKLGAQRGDHGAVVSAQPGPGYPQPDARGFAPLRGQRAEPGVGRHAAADDQVGDVVLLAGLHRLAGEHVGHGFLEGGRDVGGGHRLPGRLPCFNPARHRRLQAREREVQGAVVVLAARE